MHNIIKHFDILLGHGIKPIPLHAGSKRPICKGWTDWSEETNRYVFHRYPKANMGILLGDIVDVEGDSVAANRKIIDLIGDYPHPSYCSTKSVHHLFQTPDPTLTILKHRDIEFRGHKHQSALPPSEMDSGVKYLWELTTKFPIPPMPERLLAFYQSLKCRKKSIKPGHIKVPCFKCQEDCFLHRKRFELEITAFRSVDQRWTCHSCRQIDLRPICRELRKHTTLVERIL